MSNLWNRSSVRHGREYNDQPYILGFLRCFANLVLRVLLTYPCRKYVAVKTSTSKYLSDAGPSEVQRDWTALTSPKSTQNCMLVADLDQVADVINISIQRIIEDFSLVKGSYVRECRAGMIASLSCSAAHTTRLDPWTKSSHSSMEHQSERIYKIHPASN